MAFKCMSVSVWDWEDRLARGWVRVSEGYMA